MVGSLFDVAKALGGQFRDELHRDHRSAAFGLDIRDQLPSNELERAVEIPQAKAEQNPDERPPALGEDDPVKRVLPFDPVAQNSVVPVEGLDFATKNIMLDMR